MQMQLLSMCQPLLKNVCICTVIVVTVTNNSICPLHKLFCSHCLVESHNLLFPPQSVLHDKAKQRPEPTCCSLCCMVVRDECKDPGPLLPHFTHQHSIFSQLACWARKHIIISIDYDTTQPTINHITCSPRSCLPGSCPDQTYTSVNILLVLPCVFPITFLIVCAVHELPSKCPSHGILLLRKIEDFSETDFPH